MQNVLTTEEVKVVNEVELAAALKELKDVTHRLMCSHEEVEQLRDACDQMSADYAALQERYEAAEDLIVDDNIQIKDLLAAYSKLQRKNKQLELASALSQNTLTCIVQLIEPFRPGTRIDSAVVSLAAFIDEIEYLLPSQELNLDKSIDARVQLRAEQRADAGMEVALAGAELLEHGV